MCRGSVPSIALGEMTEVDVFAVGSGRQQVSFSSLKITWFQREKKKRFEYQKDVWNQVWFKTKVK